MTDDMVVRRPLRSFTREAAALQNRLNRPHAPLPLGDGWLLHDRPPALADAAAAWRRVDFMASGIPAALFCAPALLDAVLGTLAVGPDASPDLLPLLLELALADIIDRLEAATGTDIVVLGLSHADVPLPADTRTLRLKAFERRWTVALHAPAAVLDALFRSWPAASRSMDQLPLPAILRLGTTGLTLGVLRSLLIGDVVLLERRAGPARGMLAVAGHLLAPAEWNGSGWALRRAPTARGAEWEGWLGTSGGPGCGPDSGGAAENGPENVAEEGDIPVTLRFDLGRLELTLAELRQLGPGSVLELPGPADAPVRITVGGRCIGTGELVEVEGRAGVRVLQMLGHG